MPHPLAVQDTRGRTRIEPGAFQNTELQKAIQIRLGLNNDVFVVGNFPSGQPDIVQEFGDPEEWRKQHDAADDNDIALQLVRRMQNPFVEPNIGGAAALRSVQVGNQTRGTSDWKTGATTKLTLTTVVYGLFANKFERKFVAGTTANTTKLSVRKRGDPQTLVERDDLGLAFTIQYTGAAAAGTMTITVVSDAATKVELLEAAVVKHTFLVTDAQTKTLGQLINVIDDLTDYTCTLAAGADPLMPITFLDATAAQDIKTAAFTAKAQLGAVVWYVNEYLKDFFTAARATGQTVFGDFDTDFVFAAGGTNPTVILQDWRDSLAVLDTADYPGGYLFPVTTDAATLAVITDWIIDQYARLSKTWRAVFATAPGATASAAKTLAFGTNHSRIMIVMQRIKDFDEAGVLTDFDPIHLAAMMIGGSAGTPTTNPLTLKRVRIRGLKDSFSPTVREDLEGNGVTVIREEKNFGFVVAFAVSSSLDNKRMPRIWSDSTAVDVIHNNMFDNMKKFAGTWASLELKGSAEMLMQTVLEGLEGLGIINKGVTEEGAAIPAFDQPRATIGAGKLTGTWLARIGGEVDQLDLRGDVEYQEFGISISI